MDFKVYKVTVSKQGVWLRRILITRMWCLYLCRLDSYSW